MLFRLAGGGCSQPLVSVGGCKETYELDEAMVAHRDVLLGKGEG